MFEKFKINRKKKGFTLVELLAVIVILAIILIIAVPNVLRIIDQSREEVWERQKDIIVDATKKYTTENWGILPEEGHTINITLQELIDAGLIQEKIKDPRTNEIIDPTAEVVSITNYGDNNYSFDCIIDKFFIYNQGQFSDAWVDLDEIYTPYEVEMFKELYFEPAYGQLENKHFILEENYISISYDNINDIGIAGLNSIDSFDLEKHEKIFVRYSFGDKMETKEAVMVKPNFSEPTIQIFAILGVDQETGTALFTLSVVPSFLNGGVGIDILITEEELLQIQPLNLNIHKIWLE